MAEYSIRPVASPKALVVFCGDPRFQAPVKQFLEKELGLAEGDFVALGVAGGAASLNVGDVRPKEAKYVREAISFYLDCFGEISRIVLINHEDCAKYRAFEESLPLFSHFFGGLIEKQKADLKNSALSLLRLAGKPITVESYYAAFANPEHTLVEFQRQ